MFLEEKESFQEARVRSLASHTVEKVQVRVCFSLKLIRIHPYVDG